MVIMQQEKTEKKKKDWQRGDKIKSWRERAGAKEITVKHGEKEDVHIFSMIVEAIFVKSLHSVHKLICMFSAVHFSVCVLLPPLYRQPVCVACTCVCVRACVCLSPCMLVCTLYHHSRVNGA